MSTVHTTASRAVRRTAVAIALVLGTVVTVASLVGCGAVAPGPATPASTPSPTPTVQSTPVDPAVIYERIEQQVASLRALEPLAPVKRTTIDEPTLRQLLAEITAQEQPPAEVAAAERLYGGLGLLPAGLSLADLSADLLGEQVAGFYRTDTEELYVVSRSGALGVEEKMIFAHEFTHALQDQHFELEPLTADASTEGDRALARTALIEGDAMLLMTLWSQEHLSLGELLQLVGMAIAPNQAGLEGVPPFLVESLLFPYQSGLQFVTDIHLRGGWEGVDAAFANPPDSTEQILHPEKYAADEAPIEIELPVDLAQRLGEGWRLTLEDTLGEFQIRAWLTIAGSAAAGGSGGSGVRGVPGAVPGGEAAAGWGGDRIGLYEGPDGQWAIVLASAWDTGMDADQFAAAVPDLAHLTVRPVRPSEVLVVVGSDAATEAAAVNAALGQALHRLGG